MFLRYFSRNVVFIDFKEAQHISFNKSYRRHVKIRRIYGTAAGLFVILRYNTQICTKIQEKPRKIKNSYDQLELMPLSISKIKLFCFLNLPLLLFLNGRVNTE